MINNISAPSFGSRNCPIKPTIFNTAKGSITIQEIKHDEVRNVGEFMVNTAVDFHAKYHHYKLPENKDKLDKFYNVNIENISKTIDENDGNFSVLVARDNQKNIVGAGIMRHSWLDNKIGELDDFYISPALRGEGLGQKIGKMLLDSVKGFYTDVFVCSGREAVPFYKKLGFNFDPKVVGSYRSKAVDMLESSRPDAIIGDKNIDPKHPIEERFTQYSPYRF